MRRSTLLALILLPWALAGCVDPVAIHPPSSSPAPEHLDAVQGRLSRHKIAARGLEIHATLWDSAMITALDPQRPTSTPAIEAERARWRETYLERTSFTVAFDVAARQPVHRKTDDDLVELDHWSFSLRCGSGPPQKASEVELIGIDRYPTRKGDHHHRVVARVHFDGPLHEALAINTAPTEIELRIHSNAKLWKRPAMGMYAAKEGIALRWTVTRAAPDPAAQ